MRVVLALTTVAICSLSGVVFAQGNSSSESISLPQSGAAPQSRSWPLSNNPYSHGHIKADPVIADSVTTCKAADADAQRGAWADAVPLYQKALALIPTNPAALYGMAASRRAAGDTAGELAYYRTAIYTTLPPPYSPVVREMDAERLMKFVVLLSQAGLGQAGQSDEALTLYNRAADRINYDHGKQRHEVLLPEFGLDASQTTYTPDHLLAMAHVGVAIQAMGFDDRETLPHLQDALKLMPDSGIAYFYLGQFLYAHQKPGAQAAYDKAVQSADVQASEAAAEWIKLVRIP